MATTKLAVTTDIKVLTKNIALVVKRAESLQMDIQTVLVSCAKIIAEHGNTMPLNNLIEQMPKGVRKGAMVEWALAHAQVRLLDRSNPLDEDKIAKGQTFGYDREKLVFDEVGAMASKWWEFKPEPDLLTTFDIHKFTKQLVKRLSTATKDGAEIQGIEEAQEQLRVLQAALATLQSEGVK